MATQNVGKPTRMLTETEANRMALFLFKFQLLHPAELPASTIKCIVVGLAKSVFTIMALPRQQLWMGQGIGGHSAADVDMCTTLAGNMRVVTPVTRYSETLVPKSSNWVLPIRHIWDITYITMKNQENILTQLCLRYIAMCAQAASPHMLLVRSQYPVTSQVFDPHPSMNPQTCRILNIKMYEYPKHLQKKQKKTRHLRCNFTSILESLTSKP